MFVAVALGLPLAAAGIAIGAALLLDIQSVLNRWLLAAVGAAFVLVVGWVALLPPVRQVEVGVARTLLALELPDVTHPTSWASRRRGAAWLFVLSGLGVAVAVLILYCLPVGVGLLAHPFTGRDTIDWPGGLKTTTRPGWAGLWVVPAGVLALTACLLAVRGAGRLIAGWAPRVIGPTLSERVEVAAARERDLARANELARELHDSIGHRLTAMTIQATAARRMVRSDPAAAAEALATVEDLGRRAQADVDAVVGALRGRTPVPEAQDLDAQSLDAMVAASPLTIDAVYPGASLEQSLGVLDGPAREVARAVVREGLTNSLRHGDGTARLALTLDPTCVVVTISNPSGSDAVRTDRAGLRGLRERLMLTNGTLEAGPGRDTEEGTWTLRAALPRE